MEKKTIKKWCVIEIYANMVVLDYRSIPFMNGRNTAIRRWCELNCRDGEYVFMAKSRIVRETDRKKFWRKVANLGVTCRKIEIVFEWHGSPDMHFY